MPPAQTFSTATFEQWARHLLSPEDLHNRAEELRKLRRKELEGQGKSEPPRRGRRPPRYRYGVRTHSSPIALRAFWTMHVEALNWSGMGLAAAALGFSPMRCAYGAIAWKIPATKWTGDPCFIRAPGLN